MARRSLSGLVAGIVLMITLALPIATGRPFLGDDIGRFHRPIRDFYARCLRDGDSPLWHPGLHCGFYVHGEGQGGFDHPLHLVLYAALPLDRALAVETFVGYPLLVLGMGIWLGRRSRSLRTDGTTARRGAMFGAIVLAFSPFVVLRYVHMNALEIIAHLPWMLLAIDAIRVERKVSGRLGLSWLVASQGLLGYPQYTAMNLAITGLYATTRLDLRRCLSAGVAVAIGLLAASAQILPHVEALAGSTRAKPSLAFLGMNSLHPLNLLATLVPFGFTRGYFDPAGPAPWPRHESVGSLGAIVPAALAWVWSRRGELRRERPLIVWSLALIVGGCGLALGRYSPLFRIYARLPGVGLFRGPSRWMLAASVGAAVVSAVAIGDALRCGMRRNGVVVRRVWLGPALASLAATIGLAWVRNASIAGAAGLAESVLWVTFPALLLTKMARGTRSATALLALFLVADVWSQSLGPILSHEADRHPPASSVTTPGGRVVAEMNEGLIRGARQVNGYVALMPGKRLDVLDPTTLRLAGAITTPSPLPRFRLVSRAEVGEDPRTIDVDSTALVDRPIPLDGGPPGEVLMGSDRPGHIVVQTRASARRLLVVSESFHAGWRCSVDGVPAGVVATYGDFLGAVVEGGTHRVAFEFQPTSVSWGRGLSLLGLALGVGWAVAAGRRVVSTGERMAS